MRRPQKKLRSRFGGHSTRIEAVGKMAMKPEAKLEKASVLAINICFPVESGEFLMRKKRKVMIEVGRKLEKCEAKINQNSSLTVEK